MFTKDLKSVTSTRSCSSSAALEVSSLSTFSLASWINKAFDFFLAPSSPRRLRRASVLFLPPRSWYAGDQSWRSSICFCKLQWPIDWPFPSPTSAQCRTNPKCCTFYPWIPSDDRSWLVARGETMQSPCQAIENGEFIAGISPGYAPFQIRNAFRISHRRRRIDILLLQKLDQY